MNNFTKSLIADYLQAIEDNDEGAKQRVWSFAIMDTDLMAELNRIDEENTTIKDK